MPETSTTEENNPSGDANTSTTTDTDSTSTDNKTGEDTNNLDASKSAGDTTADDDKKSTTATSTDDTSASKFDDDLDDWAAKRGMPKAENDEQRKAYQDFRNEQREFTRSRQDNRATKDANELSKEIDTAKKDIKKDEDDDELDPLEKRQNAIEEQLREERTVRLQSEFYVEQKVTPEEHKMILDVMKEKFNRPATIEGKERALEQWSNPDALPDLLDIARARIAKTQDTSTVADEAARKERERIARESESKSPGRAASQHTTGDNADINSDEARRKRFEARYNK